MTAVHPSLIASPPLRFVAASCGWPDDPRRRALVAERAEALGEWGSVMELAAAHRVEGLVADAITALADRVPAEAAEWAAATRSAMRDQAVLEISQTLRVCEALRPIRLKILKGAPLGLQAYGRTAVKRSWDIDVLVEPADAIEAARRIAALGYAPSKPPRLLDDDELRRWSSVSKHANFSSANGMEVELHWRLTSLPGMLRGVDAASPERMVAVFGDRAVPVLPDAANLAYLAVHGTSHGWSRLKWLADFSAFVSSLDPQAMEDALAGARRLGTGHAIPASFLVRERLFGLPMPPSVSATSAAEAIADLAVSVINARSAERPIEEDREASAAIERIRRSMGEGRAYVPRYLLQRHRGTEIRALVALPKWLDWAYWLIRPYSILRRASLRRRGA